MSKGQNSLQSGPSADARITMSEEIVSHHPLSAVLVVFGIGLGVGVALGIVVSGNASPRYSLGQRTKLASEKIGRQVLDALAGVLPDSLAKHMSG